MQNVLGSWLGQSISPSGPVFLTLTGRRTPQFQAEVLPPSPLRGVCDPGNGKGLNLGASACKPFCSTTAHFCSTTPILIVLKIYCILMLRINLTTTQVCPPLRIPKLAVWGDLILKPFLTASYVQWKAGSEKGCLGLGFPASDSSLCLEAEWGAPIACLAASKPSPLCEY